MSKSRNFVFTLNNYTDEDCDYLLSIDCRYIVFGKEIAPTTGTPHLQGCIIFHSARAPAAVRKILRRCHVDPMKGTIEQSVEYAKKDNDYYEKGDKPASQAEKGTKGKDAEKTRWDEARTAAIEGRLDDVPSDIYIRYYSTLCKIASDHMELPKERDVLENYWIYGATGVGKSRGVRQHFGTENIYPKPLNKWWDGYQGQKVVLIEEVSPEHANWLGEKLKIWADHYPFIGETKGKSMPIRPPIVVITSNYSMEEVFTKQQDLEPLKRRFKCLHMISYNSLTNLFE